MNICQNHVFFSKNVFTIIEDVEAKWIENIKFYTF